MESTSLSRRHLIRTGLAGAGAITIARFAPTLIAGADSSDEGQLIPFVDTQPIDPKKPAVKWEDLREWITPDSDFFAVSHYGQQTVSAANWRLKVDGLVNRPIELTLEELKARPARTITATLECSGNGAGAEFMGAIGNATWTGVPMASILNECGVKSQATQAAFWAVDRGKEKIRNKEYEQNFARTLTINQATAADVLLAWEMNGRPLSHQHGFPLRLIVPGWYGIAWVKWLTRIELRDRPLMNRFTARDYVTIRGRRDKGGQLQWTETAVGPLNAKSLVGRVTRRSDGTIRMTGAAWAQDPIAKVELKIDNGPWLATSLRQPTPATYAWTFWSYDWKNPTRGEHTLVSRATDESGRVQPAADEDAIKLKQTYWEANQQYPRKFRVG
jgi:DMSO/TMAO reductase YedYZ molybdopterin-dependent catalytic subunit